MEKYKILIIGCGELGSRHLQAVASLINVAEVHIVDPRPEAIELGKARLKEISDLNRDIQFNWFNEFDKSLKFGDLCIVATRAEGRCKIVKDVADKLGYRKFLLEKVVSQSVPEYEDLLSFCHQKDILIWVNCKGRAGGIHKYIKKRINPNEPFIFSRIAGNHGLACNGVHSADLFIFYNEAKYIGSVGCRIDPIAHIPKRGGNLYDLSGTLHGFSEKGGEFILSFASNHKSPDIISVVSPRGRFFLDQFQQLFFESYPDSDWRWKQIPLKEENWLVSHMTKKFASDILDKEKCELPTLSECFPAHQYILSELQPHFNRLLKTNNDFCPVT